MIVTVFNFFQIHWKVIPRYAPIVVQNMFSITLKPFNPGDMVFGLFTHEAFGMINHHMFSVSLQRLIPTKCIGAVDRSLAGMRLDMSHERLCRDRLHDLGVDPSIPLQQAEYDAFASRSTTPLPLTDSAEVGLIQFDLSRQLGTFQFSSMKQCDAQPLIDPSHRLGIQTQITRQSIGGLLLVKTLQDGNLAAQLGQAFLLATAHAFHIASCGLQSLKRAAENTLATIQKVGRTTKYCLNPSNHKYLQGYTGYETP
jgi:hypothetical protein